MSKIHIEIAQIPNFALVGKEVQIRTNSTDRWQVYVVNGENREKVGPKFDGFPVFSQRWDDDNQFEKALAYALDWCNLLGLPASCIRKMEGKNSPAYKKFVEEINRQKELKKERLRKELAALEG